MDELSFYTSEVIEFKPLKIIGKVLKLVDSDTNTDPLPPTKDVSLETNPKCHKETQTNTFLDQIEFAKVDENILAQWLQKIYPAVEAELREGPTPIPDIDTRNNVLSEVEANIQSYQKISMVPSTGNLESSQALATWLSVHTNNAPVLVITIVAPHDVMWCEHLNQSISVFVPKRIPHSSFVAYTETKKIPIKACLKSLVTNSYDKSMFAGSTLDGDIYIWRFEQSSGEVTELFNFTSPHGYATAMDWSAENRLLSCYSNGHITEWLVAKQVLKENEFLLEKPTSLTLPSSPSNGKFSNEITTLVCISANDFVVGTEDGGVYHCWNSNVGANRNKLEITALRRHLFMVSTVLKTRFHESTIVISCDLSGHVFYHDIQNKSDDDSNITVKIPLPFKNSIACSRDGNILYCPGTDGSLECYSALNGRNALIKGMLRGKGSLIKRSDNGCWIVIGLYTNEFQIFYIDY